MKITFGSIAALVFAHQLLLSTTTTILLACASPIPQSISPTQAAQAAQTAAAIAAAEAAQRAAEAAQRAAEAAQRATPGAGTATPDPVKKPESQLPDTDGAIGNYLTSGENWVTNKMKMRKRGGLSGEDYASSHSLSMESLEDTTGNNTPSVKSVSSPSSSGRSPLLERRRGRLYERRNNELKEEVVSPNSPEAA
ncbi:hypothetical protein EC957_002492 [Mortierella hygrophila]|uniref:Uncharacterized protein n=1 Tax=Mortierella hygrophila TaxID=979708 RepID=A0A9P6K159_9FUNG|nr:hypothetical protein EC957_002492 [Mortierella hygrophila]